MTKSELLKAVLARIQRRYGYTLRYEHADLLWDMVVEEMTERMASGEPVRLRNFGTFFLGRTAIRMIKHPKHGLLYEAGGNPVIRFTPSKSLLEKTLAHCEKEL